MYGCMCVLYVNVLCQCCMLIKCKHTLMLSDSLGFSLAKIMDRVNNACTSNTGFNSVNIEQ